MQDMYSSGLELVEDCRLKLSLLRRTMLLIEEMDLAKSVDILDKQMGILSELIKSSSFSSKITEMEERIE